MNKKILIVEDEAILFIELKRLLTKNNYKIIGYGANGYTKSYEEAMKVIRKEIPDIVLIDIVLIGEKDGIDLAKEINRLKIPFVFLSANSDNYTLNKAKETNPNTFLIKSKPFNDNQLLATLQMAINQKEKPQPTKGIAAREVMENNQYSNTHTLLDFDEICFIVTNSINRNTTIINVVDSNCDQSPFKFKRYYLNESLKSLNSILPDNFIQIHKSYIINLDKIHTKPKRGKIILFNKELPIGNHFKEIFSTTLNSMFFIKK